MKTLICLLSCFALAACGSSRNETQTEDKVATGPNPIQTVYEIRDSDTKARVGMIFVRDHGDSKLISWVHNAKGTRCGYVTADNRGFMYRTVMGKREEKAESIGEDRLAANARRIIAYGRPVDLEEIDFDTWARQANDAVGGSASKG
jgi:hypothetical protein